MAETAADVGHPYAWRCSRSLEKVPRDRGDQARLDRQTLQLPLRMPQRMAMGGARLVHLLHSGMIDTPSVSTAWQSS
ncbi:MAG TPA: hypothetical protein VNS22_07600 [Geminicoccus sp.]|uniref:hypothetical protein n=1 Tax=Geminicoccus sp. TaxID=2024832 RepID=UPI002B750339|nr:hypothetical protein [Geminicoccus sp.]HWL68236.1 hypothetical protein [Geminicoccus sp.]